MSIIKNLYQKGIVKPAIIGTTAATFIASALSPLYAQQPSQTSSKKLTPYSISGSFNVDMSANLNGKTAVGDAVTAYGFPFTIKNLGTFGKENEGASLEVLNPGDNTSIIKNFFINTYKKTNPALTSGNVMQGDLLKYLTSDADLIKVAQNIIQPNLEKRIKETTIGKQGLQQIMEAMLKKGYSKSTFVLRYKSGEESILFPLSFSLPEYTDWLKQMTDEFSTNPDSLKIYKEQMNSLKNTLEQAMKENSDLKGLLSSKGGKDVFEDLDIIVPKGEGNKLSPWISYGLPIVLAVAAGITLYGMGHFKGQQSNEGGKLSGGNDF
ncbi:MAG: hypothetical protein KKG60_01960 [Nanoarchaeota archaeon]|nr:hypothetical protein [Nanoarchaeota archaeon]